MINKYLLMFIDRQIRKPETELMICLLKLLVHVKMLEMMIGRRACTSSLAWYRQLKMNYEITLHCYVHRSKVHL
jgi:hypothetical protein